MVCHVLGARPGKRGDKRTPCQGVSPCLARSWATGLHRPCGTTGGYGRRMSPTAGSISIAPYHWRCFSDQVVTDRSDGHSTASRDPDPGLDDLVDVDAVVVAHTGPPFGGHDPLAVADLLHVGHVSEQRLDEFVTHSKQPLLKGQLTLHVTTLI